MSDPNFAQGLIEEIQKGIRGRIAHEQHNCNYLAWTIAQAGDGNHLEIGTLFGGSAILAALLKQRFGFIGNVYCIDPLDGYYLGTTYSYAVDPVCGLPINEETVMNNARYFGVEDRIIVIPKSSHPWPEEVANQNFSSAFIDGNHWNEYPKRDWLMAHPRTDKFVVFDNWDDNHPAVQEACKLASSTAGWVEEFAGEITYIVRRVGE